METFRNIISNINDIDLTSAAQFSIKEQDLNQIWHQICLYIEANMLQSRGVSIPGLGTFTFFQQKLNIGNNKHLLIQRPLFVVSEKFAQTHRLRLVRPTVSGNIPTQAINYTLISNRTGLARDYIQLCVKHVLQMFNRSVMATRGRGECLFEKIGRLVVQKGHVEMVFLVEFVSSLEVARKAMTRPRKEEIRISSDNQLKVRYLLIA